MQKDFDELSKVAQWVFLEAIGADMDKLQPTLGNTPQLDIHLIVNGVELDFENVSAALMDAYEQMVAQEALRTAANEAITKSVVHESIDDLIRRLEFFRQEADDIVDEILEARRNNRD